MAEDLLLEVRGLHAGYGAVEVLHGVDLQVRAGEIVSIVGANGAGKSTLVNAISGVVRPTRGSVRFAGRDLARLSVAETARGGIRQVPEGRRVFADLSVEDNLRMGGYGRRHADVTRDLAQVFDLFPRLLQRRQQMAGTLSGGEQQMVAIGRAIMGKPQLLTLDEPSMGLAPLITGEIFRLVERLQRELRISVLLIEQNARAALGLSDRAHVLSLGRFTLSGTGEELLNDPRVREAFLGTHTQTIAAP